MSKGRSNVYILRDVINLKDPFYGAFNITGIAAPANLNTNQKLVLINVSGQTMTLTYGSGSSSFNNQLLIGGSADLPITTNGVVELIYSIFRPGWYVAGHKA